MKCDNGGCGGGGGVGGGGGNGGDKAYAAKVGAYK